MYVPRAFTCWILIRFVMTVLKIIYKALVMKHCFCKVEDLNGDREPPFPFFKFSFTRMCVCVCVFILFILFMSPFLLLLTYYLRLLRLSFILFWYCFYSFYWKMRIQNTENSEKDNSETKQEIRTKREVNKNETKI